MSSSNISSSKQESAHRNLLSNCKLRNKESYRELRNCDSKSEVSQSESLKGLLKRKSTVKIIESENSYLKKSKQKNNSIDFDKIFNNHGNSGKYGFGFSRQEQLNLESEFFCSTSSHNQSNYTKSSSDYKAINFIKSDHVFDLSTLNNNIYHDNASQSKSHESSEASDNKNENIYAPGPSGLNLVKEVSNSEDSLFIESKIVHNENSSDKENIDTSSSVNNSLPQSSNTEPGTSHDNDKPNDGSLSKVNHLFKVNENIDEIDCQLSEALEAKVSSFIFIRLLCKIYF